MILGLVLLLGGAVLADAASAATDPVFGRWVVEDGKAVIEIEPCGDAACGRLVWLKSPWEANGSPKSDAENPDPKMRRRPLCGLRLVTGLERADDGTWEDGEIYSTRDGRTYGIEIAPDGEDRLAVRGYVGISLLGKTQTWTRDSIRRGNCTVMGSPGINR